MSNQTPSLKVGIIDVDKHASGVTIGDMEIAFLEVHSSLFDVRKWLTEIDPELHPPAPLLVA
jgi:hypothetical protein